ncbi:MAG TPA: hypothetical protein PK275_07835 [Chitinophagaceae bacterium]|nr:hypothetical protein [Chitinophagaceae bacterium]
MKLRTIHLSILLVFATIVQAQNINGIWKGTVVMAPGGCFPVYNIEMQLQIAGSQVTGTAYHFSDSLNYVREQFEGVYNKDSNTIIIQETGIISYKVKDDCVPCIKKYRLTYHRGGDNVVKEEQLRGTWTGKALDGKTVCDPGRVTFVRFDKSSFKPEFKLPPALTNRKAELVKEIKVDTGHIKIDFYDNGQIDGDTISVYVNGSPVISRKMITAKPTSMSVTIDLKKPVQEVIMVGENQGSIPPNTALMIIKAGEKRYQLLLTSDDKKNAMVRFIYEKTELK